jgi:hypothetical protein
VKAVAPSPNEQGQKPIAKPAPVKAVAKPAPVKARANNNQRANLPSEVAKRSLQPVSKKPVKAKVTTPSPKLTVPKPTPAKKMNFLEKMFTPTKESIAKNKIAGAKFTASQKAKGIGVARSNITDGGGNRIKGVANSQSNPALQKLAKEGKRGAEGLNTLAARQSAQTGKDTSFSGIAKSLMSGEKHAPRQSLLQFGSGDPRGENNVHKDYSTSPKLNAVPSGFGGKVGGGKVSTAAPKKKIAVTVGQSSGGSGGSNQDTALAGGAAATATNQPDNLKNMLAIKKNAQRQGKRKLRQKRNTSVGFGNGGVGLNITT